MDEYTSKAQQVAQQCKVVEELAHVIADIHHNYHRAFSKHPESVEAIVDIVGKRSARLMEAFGNILNGMDAAEEQHEWMDPIFRKAQEMFPVESSSNQP